MKYNEGNGDRCRAAGCRLPWQLAEHGIEVRLYEMRPGKMTPAHETDKMAELVCSNSLKSDSMDNAAGLLKEEMRRMNSLILEAADRNRVPAGSALAVDREGFSTYLTRKIEQHPNIRLIRQEVTDIPDDKDEPIIVATGPLSSSSISAYQLIRQDYLYFYDALP